ncbi:MAG TPA: LamG domain-containing protein, partial [Methylococcales bacterium]
INSGNAEWHAQKTNSSGAVQWGDNGKIAGTAPTVSCDNSLPTWTSNGKYDGAFQFDGVNDYLSSVQNVGISGASPRSLSLWVKTTGTNRQSLAGWGNGGTGNAFDLEVSVADAGCPAGNIYFIGYYSDICTSFKVNDDVWHHVVAVYDGSNVTLYGDGASIATMPYALTTLDTPLFIGEQSYPDYSHFYFNGSIDDVRVYNRALSDTEVSDIYANTPSSSGLTLLYNFDSAPAGGVITDNSGNSHNASCNFINNSNNIQGMPDGNGGLFYVYDHNDTTISARHLNSSGDEQFPADFALATTGDCASTNVKLGTYGIYNYTDVPWVQTISIKKHEVNSIMPDGNGGFIAWWQGISSNILCAQRVDASGNRLWGDSGVVLASSDNSTNLLPDRYRIMSDGANGIIAVVPTSETPTRVDHFIVKKINGADGTTSWTNNFNPANAGEINTAPGLVTDGSGGVFISYGAWSSYNSTFITHINSSGSTVSGCGQMLPDSRIHHGIVSDGAGGAVI